MSRSILAPLLLIAGLLAATSAVRAQEPPRIHWHVMGGYSETLGSTSDYLQGGYAVGAGFSVSPTWSPFDFRFDLNYSVHNASIALLNTGQQATNQPVDTGTGSILSATGNLAYHVPLAYGVQAYGIAGVGAYYTRIELDQILPFYDPYGYYGYCYWYCYGYGQAQVAAHGVTNFGWNAGLGVEFALPYGRSWFIEARYQRINSSTYIQYLPIEIGYRF
jgi:opacity protein-like surface antigen